MKQIVTLLMGIAFGILMPVMNDADLLRMKDGRLVEGKFLGGTEYRVRFHTAAGTVEYPVADLLSISFLPPNASLPDRTPQPTPAPTPRPPAPEILMPPNTRLSVRTSAPLDSLASRAGDVFDTTLENDLVVEGEVIAPKGTLVHGKVITSEQGKAGSSLVIVLQEIVLTHQKVPVTTTSYAMWDRPKSDTDTTLHTIRTLRIPAGAFLEFKTTEAVTIKRPF